MSHPFIKKWHPASLQIITNFNNIPRRQHGCKPVEFNTCQDDVEFVVSQIEAYQFDLTSDYKDWVDLGFSFAHEFGEAGRSYYHRISRFYSGYSIQECDRQYDRCLRGKRSGRTIRSFFHTARLAGMDISRKNK